MDFTGYTNLERLQCAVNPISSLILTDCSKLTYIQAETCNLTTVKLPFNLGGVLKFNNIFLSRNPLEQFDIQHVSQPYANSTILALGCALTLEFIEEFLYYMADDGQTPAVINFTNGEGGTNADVSGSAVAVAAITTLISRGCDVKCHGYPV